MKTQIILSIVLLFTFSSCVDDYYGHPDDKEGILTSTNYVYSDDIRAEFLELQGAALEEEIKILGGAIESGNATPEQEERFQTAQDELSSTSKTLIEIAEFRELVYKGIPLPPPPPPCPKPRNCNDWLNFNYVTIPSGQSEFGLLIYDQNQNVIGQTEGKPTALVGVDGLLDYVVLIFDDTQYEGDILVKAFGTMENGTSFSYFIESSIN